jgi:GH35 family endo-1,4-beta-xylanase
VAAGAGPDLVAQTANFTTTPASSGYVTDAEGPSNTGLTNYGDRLRGYVTAPQTGTYTFWVAGADQAALVLSDDAGPANVQQLATVPDNGFTASREWTKYPEQQSAPVWLVAGQQYYLEVRHKQGSSADNEAVGWQLPDSTLQLPIPGAELTPWLPTVKLWSVDNNANRYGHAATFTVTRDGDLGRDLTVRYALGGSAVNGTDYAALPGAVVIPRGQASASVTLSPRPGTSPALTASLTLQPSAAGDYALSVPSSTTATATIAAGVPLPTGTAVVPPTWLNNVIYNGTQYGSFTRVAVSGLPFTQAGQVTVTTQPPQEYQSQALINTNAAIQQGDNVVISLWLRSANPASPQGLVTLGFQQSSSPYSHTASQLFALGTTWRQIDLPFTSSLAFAPAGGGVLLNLGRQPQTVQFGGLSVTDYGRAPGAAALPADWLTGRTYNGSGTYATYSTVGAGSQPFTQAAQARVTTVPPHAYDAQVLAATTAAVSAGDHLLITAWLRSADAAHPLAQVGVGFQQSSSPFAHDANRQFAFSASWTRIDLPFTATRAYPAGGGEVVFDLGAQLQTVQIGGVALTDYAGGVGLPLLPQTSNTYVGREPDAAWRARADQGIDQNRKADLSVTVTDANGTPLDGALVNLQLTRLAFNYGSALAGSRLINDHTAAGDTYRNTALALFNTATLENDLKWPSWLSNRQLGIAAANWVVNNGLALRGHNLVWPSWGNTPSSTGASSGTYRGVAWASSSGVPASRAEYNAHVTADGLAAAKAWLSQRVLDHIADEAGTLAGLPSEWDVVNEPYSNHDLMDTLGQSSILDWYNQAVSADPNAAQFLNDYSQIENYATDAAHQNATYNWARYLISNGVRLDRIGFQSHFGTQLTGMDAIRSVLDGYRTLGTGMEVTEFDTNLTDEQLQADYERDFLTEVFSDPSMTGVVKWGFWESQHWRPVAAMYRSDWSLKPNGQVWIDLTQQQWSTNATGTTWDGGVYTAHGFDGAYAVTVTYAGQSYATTATLSPGGTALAFALPFVVPPAPPPGAGGAAADGLAASVAGALLKADDGHDRGQIRQPAGSEAGDTSPRLDLSPSRVDVGRLEPGALGRARGVPSASWLRTGRPPVLFVGATGDPSVDTPVD